MDVLDSTANFAGLSLLSTGAVPAASTSDTTQAPDLSAVDFAQQLQALTAAIGNPQALVVELQATGLIEAVPTQPSATPATSDPTAIIAQLSELVARLLQGTEQPPEPAPQAIEADSVAEPAAKTPAFVPRLVEPSPDGKCLPAAECPAEDDESLPAPAPIPIALLQTIAAWFFEPPVAPAPQTTEPAAAAPAPPAGLVDALAVVMPPPLANVLVETPTKPVTEPQPTAPNSERPTDDKETMPTAIAVSTPVPTVLPVAPASVAPAPAPAPVAVVTEPTPVAPAATLAEPSVSPPFVTPAIGSASTVTTAQPLVESTDYTTATPPAQTRPVDKSLPATPIDRSPGDTPAAESERDETVVRTVVSKDSPPEALPTSTTNRNDQLPAAATYAVPVADNAIVSGAEPRSIPPQDSQRLVEHLGQYIVEARDQGQQLSVQITPSDLGPLRIDVSTHQGQVTARLATESTVAQQLLQDHLPQLHEALQHLGASVERIDIVRTEPPARDRNWDRTTGGGGGASTDWSASSGQSSPDRREEPRHPQSASVRRARPEKPQATADVATVTLQELNIRI